jgi:hypothetical protein
MTDRVSVLGGAARSATARSAGAIMAAIYRNGGGTVAGELQAWRAPVTSGSTPTKERLDAAVDGVARLGRTIQLTYDQCLAARTNSAQRWIVHNPGKVGAAGLAAGTAACLAGAAGVAGGFPSEAVWMFLAPLTLLCGIVGLAGASNVRERFADRGVGSKNPLHSKDVGTVTDHLRGMSQRTRALVHAHLTGWAAQCVSLGHLTPPANETLGAELERRSTRERVARRSRRDSAERDDDRQLERCPRLAGGAVGAAFRMPGR